MIEPLPSFKTMRKMPRPAFFLGAMGAFPLTTLASMIVTGLQVPGVDTTFALLVYSAIVLSLMGGVHWGLAMVMAADPDTQWGTRREWRTYGASLVPAFFAWLALLLPTKVGGWVMAVTFVGLLAYDFWCIRLGEAPAWFWQLRWPLVVMAAGSLAVAMIVTVQI